MKRLIYCLDGTSNEYDAAYPTNVVMMHKSIAEFDDNGVKQIAYYHYGVGTKFGEKIRGGAFGYKLLEYIMNAYRHLCENYEVGDEIYIFGFSRGAFTARSFAGLIGWCGILDTKNIAEIDQAKEYYEERLRKEKKHVDEFKQWRMDNCSSRCASNDDYDFRKECSAEGAAIPEIVKIRYIGIWDTVKTLGLFDKAEWHDDHLSNHVDFARHAIALDERRGKFNVTEWDNIEELNQKAKENNREGKPYQQVWFPGTHGSVGGGGPVRGLSDEAFQWVRRGAKEAGLAFLAKGDAEIFALKPNPLAHLYNGVGGVDTFYKKTKSWFFKGLYFITGMIDRTGPKTIDEIHKSAVIRYFAKAHYLPEKTPYSPASLEQVKDILDRIPPPFDESAYTAYKSAIDTDSSTDDDGKKITISGNQFIIYTVKRGDTLSAIAKANTGKAGNWRKIHKANAASIHNPDLVYIGQRIFIPLALIE